MEMRIECRKCRHVERIDPNDATEYVASVHRRNAMASAHRFEPVDKAHPDITLHGSLDGVPCPICEAMDWQVDAIKPLRGEGKDE